jgi:hypothetical protein
MNNKEKYYNYVVNDIVKNTEIDYDQETIKFPFLHSLSPFPLSHPFSSPLLYFPLFIKYVKTRYGARYEEIKIIWNLYKEKIQPLIKK